jgi:hypothetical protein
MHHKSEESACLVERGNEHDSCASILGRFWGDDEFRVLQRGNVYSSITSWWLSKTNSGKRHEE